MRILHLSSLYPPYIYGGAEKVTALLAEAQAAIGHDVAVATLVPTPTPATRLNGVSVYPVNNSNPCWIQDLPNRPAPLRMVNKAVTIANPLVTHGIAKAIRDFRPDVVHSQSMSILPPTIWRSAAKAGAAVVHTLHDYDLLCARCTLFSNDHNCGHDRRALCRVNSGWKSLFVEQIDHVAGVSRAVLNEHLERGVFADWAQERRHVVPNGTPLDCRMPPPRPAGMPFTFGFLGRLVTQKGIGMLIDACRRMPAGDWRLRIAGEGAEDNPFVAQAAGLPIEFCGFVDTASFLDTLDVLVVPSIWRDPYPTVILEAKSAGVAVIGSRRGGIPEAIGAEGAGWTYDPDDPDALVALMAERVAAGRAALPDPAVFARSHAALAPARMRDAYLDIYGQAIAFRRDAPLRKAA